MFSEFLQRNNIQFHLDIEEVAALEREAMDKNIDEQRWQFILNRFFPINEYPEIYSAYKSIDKPPFNNIELVKSGLHVFRRVFSQYAHNRRAVNGNSVYDKQGILIHQNVFDQETVSSIRREFNLFQEGIVNKQQHNIVALNSNKAPNMFRAMEEMRKLIIDCIGIETQEIISKYYNNTFAQRVVNSPEDNDNQKNCHVDTFFPAIKWWYFPDEVKPESGPFCYGINSCYPNEEYLDWLYQETIKCCSNKYDSWKLKDHQEGSFRASEEELKKMKFYVQPIPVKQNTLVIGNVGGFHRRGDTITKHVRNAIHGSIRIDSPFL